MNPTLQQYLAGRREASPTLANRRRTEGYNLALLQLLDARKVVRNAYEYTERERRALKELDADAALPSDRQQYSARGRAEERARRQAALAVKLTELHER